MHNNIKSTRILDMIHNIYFCILLISSIVFLSCGETDSESNDVSEMMETENTSCVTPCFNIDETYVSQNQSWNLNLTQVSNDPPLQGLNQWTFSLQNPEGVALESCEILVKPYMPDHKHGSRDVNASWLQGDSYQVSDLDFIMPGLWEITFEITCMDLMDTVSFEFWLNP